MPNQLIDGAKVKPLKPIADERGHLMELVRRDDPNFIKFGQTYMTTAYPGVVKGWHYHKVQVDNFCCVHGQIKLVLYDDRPQSPTKGVVNSDLKVHGVDNLWIFDSSVFPAPITLNIQYTTMALTRYAALRMPAMEHRASGPS